MTRAPITHTFREEREGDRYLRTTWHTEAGLVVLSWWRGNLCVGSFRLAADEVPELLAVLQAGLDELSAPERQPRPRAEERADEQGGDPSDDRRGDPGAELAGPETRPLSAG